MELDGDIGVRGTFGAFSFDLGGIIYGYPNTPGRLLAPPVTWEEIYIKPSYTVNDWLTLGGNFFYTPSYENSGAAAEYLSGTAKITLPGQFTGFSISGEFGHQFFSSKTDTAISGTATAPASPPSTRLHPRPAARLQYLERRSLL